MSWWVSLMQDDETVIVDTHAEGGTYVMGGTSEASLNITYNYSRLYFAHFDREKGLRWLDGKTAQEALPKLEKAVGTLGTEKYQGPFWQWDWRKDIPDEIKKPEGVLVRPDDLSPDKLTEYIQRGYLRDGGSYWKPTPGNAGYALNILKQWAEQYHDAVFRVN